MPYLSIIAASRNDDHGGNPLYRTQIFVDSFLQQCERHQLCAELILVEWNPPQDRPSLAEAIDWRYQNSWVECRVITVPFERHILLRFARALPLFQMIAKNVGIRRAQGEFILATNIDVLFSEELMSTLAKRILRADRHYRCDRFDISHQIPKDVSLDEKLQFARANLVCCHHRKRLSNIADLQTKGAPLKAIFNAALKTGQFEVETNEGISTLTAKPDVPLRWLHLDACGDFALLHRNGWQEIHGYAEFELFSLHIDSLGLMAAHRSRLYEAWFPPPAVCYHINHAYDSGFDPLNPKPMFERLEKQGISWLDFEVIQPLLKEKQFMQFNTEKWGLRDIPLDETLCTRHKLEIRKVPASLQAAPFAPVTALRPEFSADQHLRNAIKQLKQKLKSQPHHQPTGIQRLRDPLRQLLRDITIQLKKIYCLAK
ncbi:MAG: hypothetical protein C5B47_05630 [Verrucomicrobia bacterium]|nr:MAG: hypothetical protein C5B47_05630 [Verrucomicrobiota bacterium]